MDNEPNQLQNQKSTSELSSTAIREMGLICDEVLMQKTKSVSTDIHNNTENTLPEQQEQLSTHMELTEINSNNDTDTKLYLQMSSTEIISNNDTDSKLYLQMSSTEIISNNDTDSKLYLQMSSTENFTPSPQSAHVSVAIQSQPDFAPKKESLAPPVPVPVAIQWTKTLSRVDQAIEKAILKIGVVHEATKTTTANLQKNEANTHNEKTESTRKLFLCYFFFCLLWGHLESLPGSLFSELITQLEISEVQLGSIFVSKSIAFCLSSIIAAYIIDKYESSHKYSAFIFFISGISVALIAYINKVYIQYILWICIGSASGLIEVGIPVYSFRAFTGDNSAKIWFKLMSAYNLAKTVTPLIIQTSISMFSTFSYSSFIVAFVAYSGSMLLFVLETPKHDEYRAMKKQIAKTDTMRNAESVLKELEPHKMMRNIIIFLFAMVTMMYGCIMSGLVTFITLYVTSYLNISVVIGRYLISAFYAGAFVYRFWIGFCLCSCFKKRMHSTNYLFISLITGYATYAILFAIWIVFTLFDGININIQIIILFIVFAVGGFASSSTYPNTFELIEGIFPVNGIIACTFTIALGIGDLIIVVIMSKLFESFNAGVQPIPLLFASIIQIIILIVTMILYKKYKTYEAVILAGKTRQLSALRGLGSGMLSRPLSQIPPEMQVSISVFHLNYSYN
eukprot:121280_1